MPSLGTLTPPIQGPPPSLHHSKPATMLVHHKIFLRQVLTEEGLHTHAHAIERKALQPERFCTQQTKAQYSHVNEVSGFWSVTEIRRRDMWCNAGQW